MQADGFNAVAWVRLLVAISLFRVRKLLDLAAATLNENTQHDDKQHSGDGPDQQCAIHCENSFLQALMSKNMEPVGTVEVTAGEEPVPRYKRLKTCWTEFCDAVDCATGRSAQTALADARAAALHKNAENDREQNAGDDANDLSAVHTDPPFRCYALNRFLNESIMMMTAGPSVTRNSDGKMKKTSGKMSLMVVLAACSSTC